MRTIPEQATLHQGSPRQTLRRHSLGTNGDSCSSTTNWTSLSLVSLSLVGVWTPSRESAHALCPNASTPGKPGFTGHTYAATSKENRSLVRPELQEL